MYRNGSFVWLDLLTTDVKKAQDFYGKVFDWKIEMFKFPDGEYPMIKVGDHTFGGYMPAPEGMPTMWLPHLSVDDVDARAEAVTKAGGKVMREPSDMPSVGRGAGVVDATGAGFSLFRAEESDSEKQSGHGTLSWMELWTDDLEKSKHFYADAFGYTFSSMPMGEMTYWMLKPGPADAIAGLMESPMENVPSMWLPYIEVKSADACAKAAKDNGGELLGPINQQPGVGRFGMFKDPTGGVIGFMQPE